MNKLYKEITYPSKNFYSGICNDEEEHIKYNHKIFIHVI